MKQHAFVIFDPSAADLPMPNDALLDSESNRLQLPTDQDDLTAVDVELRERLNQQDGWSSVSALTLNFQNPYSESLNAQTLQVWEWGATPQQVADLTVELDPSGWEVTIYAPHDGWKRNAIYYAWILGGSSGVKTETQQHRGPTLHLLPAK